MNTPAPFSVFAFAALAGRGWLLFGWERVATVFGAVAGGHPRDSALEELSVCLCVNTEVGSNQWNVVRVFRVFCARGPCMPRVCGDAGMCGAQSLLPGS